MTHRSKIAHLLVTALLPLAAACGNDSLDKGDPFPVTENDVAVGVDAGGDTDHTTDGGGGADVAPPVDGPRAMVEPAQLEFEAGPLGSPQVRITTITNAGEGTLELGGLLLVETTIDDAGGAEFSPGDDWLVEAVLAPGQSLNLSVVYTPSDASVDEGYVEVASNDPQLDGGTVRIPIRSVGAAAPDIWSTSLVSFDRVPPVDNTTRDQFWQLFDVRNVGGAALLLSDVVISPPMGAFSVSFPISSDPNADPSTDAGAPAGSIAPGDSMPVRVYFNPISDLPASAELLFFSNDPDSPEHLVELRGNAGTPCARLSEETAIDFGTAAVGAVTNRTIVIENCSSTVDLQVNGVDACTNLANGMCDGTSAIFDIDPNSLPGTPFVLGPRETRAFAATFTPQSNALATGTVTVTTDDPTRPVIDVTTIGRGTDTNACPMALAEAREASMTTWTTSINTIPLKTIEFRGTGSNDPDGTIARYEWSLVQRPVSSTARFTPTADVAEPDLFLDLAGIYVAELTVYDDDDTASCGPRALVTITAVPDEDVHVQLVWDTPTDADQNDAAGTDMDLHFLHPNGSWNNLPWDVFWNNPTADWGAPGPADDPSLDIDDTDGAGPENINLNDPESGLTYAIGVYYYADNGHGPSYATIRVFIDGALQYDYRDMYLPSGGTFWYAATLSWPSGNVLPVNQVQQGFPNSP